MRKLTPGENVIKYGILTGGLGAWLVYTVWLGKKEDREEEERVEAEVERIEQWKKEFIDMEDVVADDEIMDSLSKRVSTLRQRQACQHQDEAYMNVFGTIQNLSDCCDKSLSYHGMLVKISPHLTTVMLPWFL